MRRLVADVTTFHISCDLPVLHKPAFPIDGSRQRLRIKLIEEELGELLEAHGNGDLADLTDAIIDLIYVLVGMGLEYGLPLEEAWDLVQAANMAKVDPATGKVLKRPDGKVSKPEGWKPPDIEALIIERTCK